MAQAVAYYRVSTRAKGRSALGLDKFGRDRDGAERPRDPDGAGRALARLQSQERPAAARWVGNHFIGGKYRLLGAALVGIGVAVYARWDDWRRGRR